MSSELRERERKERECGEEEELRAKCGGKRECEEPQRTCGQSWVETLPPWSHRENFRTSVDLWMVLLSHFYSTSSWSSSWCFFVGTTAG